MVYREGLKVICVNNESLDKCAIELGKIYTVRGKYKCPCGSDQLILKEEFYQMKMECKCGHTEYRYQSYYEWRFRPHDVS